MSFTHINNISMVLATWQKYIKKLYPDLNIICVDSLDYDNIQTQMRAKSSLKEESVQKSEILAYKRTKPLGYSFGKRPSIALSHNISGGVASGYDVVRGRIELEWLYLSNQPARTENFEIEYALKTGISSIGNFELNLSEANIGKFKYQCLWEDLSTLIMSFEDKRYNSVGGICKIDGDYFTTHGELAGLIKEIRFRILSENTDETGSQLVHTLTIDNT
jgi:hypothetical protein